ncbi:MAG TPA: hypothetical protein VEC17_00955 [Candidatus Binatia bacterium]|nr:hypothetical protein [Candidatus Binatia bacterium]
MERYSYACCVSVRFKGEVSYEPQKWIYILTKDIPSELDVKLDDRTKLRDRIEKAWLSEYPNSLNLLLIVGLSEKQQDLLEKLHRAFHSWDRDRNGEVGVSVFADGSDAESYMKRAQDANTNNGRVLPFTKRKAA